MDLRSDGIRPCPSRHRSGLADEERHAGIQALLGAPETEDTTFYFFSHAANSKLDDPNVIDVVFGGVHKAFIEDKVIIEAQQAALKLGMPLEPITIVHDAAMIKAAPSSTQ